MRALQEDFEGLIYCQPNIKKRFVTLLLSELTNVKYSANNDVFSYAVLDFLQRFVPIYLAVLEQNFNSITNVEALFIEFCDRFRDFEDNLSEIFENVFDKLYKEKISFDFELDIEPIERYLLIQEKIPFQYPADASFLIRSRYKDNSDIRFNTLKQEFESLLTDRKNKNILSVGINYCYANFNLPKCYDIIFDSTDKTKFWEQKTVVRAAFNFRTVFHTDLWRGHHSHCLVEIIGNIPMIFDELPNNDGGRNLHPGIGLCSKYDWQYIKL